MGDSSTKIKQIEINLLFHIKEHRKREKIKHAVTIRYIWDNGTKPCTLVNESVGKDTPKKKPKTIPAKVVIISLMVSFGFLTLLLHPNRGEWNSY